MLTSMRSMPAGSTLCRAIGSLASGMRDATSWITLLRRIRNFGIAVDAGASIGDAVPLLNFLPWGSPPVSWRVLVKLASAQFRCGVPACVS